MLFISNVFHLSPSLALYSSFIYFYFFKTNAITGWAWEGVGLNALLGRTAAPVFDGSEGAVEALARGLGGGVGTLLALGLGAPLLKALVATTTTITLTTTTTRRRTVNKAMTTKDESAAARPSDGESDPALRSGGGGGVASSGVVGGVASGARARAEAAARVDASRAARSGVGGVGGVGDGLRAPVSAQRRSAV